MRSLSLVSSSKAESMDVKAYLKRIQFTGTLTPNLKLLARLQKNHLLNVPFENLDIHNQVKIDIANAYNKIVVLKRGGFCYELNSSFSQLLKKLGFTVRIISARAFQKGKGFGKEFDHLALIVTIDQVEYLTDVGFGEFSFYPLKIELNKEVTDPRGIFRIRKFRGNYLVVEKKGPGGDFIPEYIFSKAKKKLQQFEKMCHYHQTSPHSHFTQKRLCSLPTKEGRVILTGKRLKIVNNKTTVERLIGKKEEEKILWKYFKIRLAS